MVHDLTCCLFLCVLYRPGGVFITVSAPSDPVATPTATTPAAASSIDENDNSKVPSETAAPEPKPTTGAGAGAAFAAGTACEDNGAWNCVDGKQYQRCAHGAWTVTQPVSAGTQCAPGVMRDIIITKRSAPAL
jgi:hypothetical protein